jgi:hypothetical protein
VCEFSGSEADSTKEIKNFYTIIVEPMVRWCTKPIDAWPLIHIQRDNLCEKVKQLNVLFPELIELFNKQKRGNSQEVKVEIDNKLRQIPEVIKTELYDLIGIYKDNDLLTSAEWKSIRKQVARIADGHLNAQFEQIYGQLVHKLREGENSSRNIRDTTVTRKLASRFLLIGKRMEEMITTTDVGGKVQWAFRQFAAHLTVIHTMRLDTIYAPKLFIQSIGDKWPIY